MPGTIECWVVGGTAIEVGPGYSVHLLLAQGQQWLRLAARPPQKLLAYWSCPASEIPITRADQVIAELARRLAAFHQTRRIRSLFEATLLRPTGWEFWGRNAVPPPLAEYAETAEFLQTLEEGYGSL